MPNMIKSLEPSKGHIIVECDPSQNREVLISGQAFLTQKRYNINYRERNPVIAKVVQGLDNIKTGMSIVCNYSHFEEDSPWHMKSNLFSIPVDNSILGWVAEDGDLHPLCGNVFVTRVLK